MDMDKVFKAAAAAVGAVASFFLGMPPILLVLLAVMSLDYVTGIICACMGKSLKTEHGGLSSGEAFLGLMKKVLVLAVVALAALLDVAVQQSAGVEFAAVTGATCLWFIASEGISIVENAANMGIPIPQPVRQALEILKGGSEKTGE
ncbi:MAG: phage holin family protein [Clostridia bacterium]|nr:phage holin family protein [Clostridia bacterium]